MPRETRRRVRLDGHRGSGHCAGWHERTGFNTLSEAWRLQGAKSSREQAEAPTYAHARAELKRNFKISRAELLQWFVSIIGVQTVTLLAALIGAAGMVAR